MRVVPERIDEAAQRTARERLPIDGVLVDEALLDEPDGLIEQLRVDERLVVLGFCLARPGGQRHDGDEDGGGERDEDLRVRGAVRSGTGVVLRIGSAAHHG